MNNLEKIKELVNQGYENLTISETDFIQFMQKHSSNICLLVDNKKVWVHFDNTFSSPILERDISDGSDINLNDI